MFSRVINSLIRSSKANMEDIIGKVQKQSSVVMTLTIGSKHPSPGGKPITEGMHIAPSKTALPPNVTISGAQPDSTYTLICSDPDAPDPNNPTAREYLHWIVTDIKGGSMHASREAVSWVPASPPIGFHKYIFALYQNQQPERAIHVSPGLSKNRKNFSQKHFAEDNELGGPIAATYFLSSKEEE